MSFARQLVSISEMGFQQSFWKQTKCAKYQDGCQEGCHSLNLAILTQCSIHGSYA